MGVKQVAEILSYDFPIPLHALNPGAFLLHAATTKWLQQAVAASRCHVVAEYART